MMMSTKDDDKNDDDDDDDDGDCDGDDGDGDCDCDSDKGRIGGGGRGVEGMMMMTKVDAYKNYSVHTQVTMCLHTAAVCKVS